MNKKFIKYLLIILVVCLLGGCSNNQSQETTTTYNSLEELNNSNINIGIWDGSMAIYKVQQYLPNANVLYYTDAISGYMAVQDGKLDAFAYEKNQMEIAIKNGQKGVKLLDETLGKKEYVGVGISPASKIDNLTDLVDNFIDEIKADGTLDDMYNRWAVEGNYQMPEIEMPTNPDFTIVVGTSGIVEPYSFYEEGELTGYDIELAHRFAKYLNAQLEIKVYDYDSIIVAASTGDIDCIMANLNITEERAEKITFSKPCYSFEIAVMVRDGESQLKYNSFEELNGKRIGIKTGTVYDAASKETFPDSRFFYYNSNSDLTMALLNDKIDGFACDDTVINEIMKENPEIGCIDEPIESYNVAFAISKNERGEILTEQINETLKELRESGKLDELYNKWMNYDSDTEFYDISTLTGENGTVTLATQTGSPPFNVALRNEVTGFEIEIVALMCEKYGYKLVVNEMYFDGLISSVESGKADIACGGMGITEERAKLVRFSDVSAVVDGKVAVLKQNVSSENSFFKEISDSFERTFIRENRWKLFINGIVTTMLITVLAILFGTIIGFVFYMASRNNEVIQMFSNFMIWLIQGLPMVVFLLILYYVIFAKVSVSGFFVAVVGFSLTFACSMYRMLQGGVNAIDKGQYEAAIALGYSDRKSFYQIILPQAAIHFLPTYKSEIVSLIKATAVVGYIAVQDLTKIGDIIRSRTFEAFFPLIVIAIFYFIMAAILTTIVKAIDFKMDPKKRTTDQILKGIKTHD